MGLSSILTGPEELGPILSNKIITTACAVLLITTLTYSYSSICAAIRVRNKADGSPPPTLPYAVPLLGHVPEFLWDAENFITKAL